MAEKKKETSGKKKSEKTAGAEKKELEKVMKKELGLDVSESKKAEKEFEKEDKKDKDDKKDVKKEEDKKDKEVKKDVKKEEDKKIDNKKIDEKENVKSEFSSKLEELKAKAKALEGKFEESKEVDVKKVVKGNDEEKEDLLVPIGDYLKSSIHLGTRVITPDMKKYVYKRRADGLAVFNTTLLDEKIIEGAEYLAKFAPEKIAVVCKREAGWDAARLFGELFGMKVFTKKYPAGSLTNPNLDDFFEADMVFISDPWLDKNALNDSVKIKMKIMGLCDTNNYTKHINQVLPGNNKSAKSLGMVYYLLAKLYAKKRKIDVKIPPIEEFIENWESAQIPA